MSKDTEKYKVGDELKSISLANGCLRKFCSSESDDVYLKHIKCMLYIFYNNPYSVL